MLYVGLFYFISLVSLQQVSNTWKLQNKANFIRVKVHNLHHRKTLSDLKRNTRVCAYGPTDIIYSSLFRF